MASVKKAQVIITADASVAKKVMDELQQRATQAANKMKQLAAAGKQNSKEFKDAKKDFDAYNSALRENVKDTKRVEEVMKNLAGTATRDLKRALQAGKRELDKMSARDPNRAKLVNDLKKIQAQIDANTGAIKRQQSAWGSLGTTLKNLVAYAGIFAGFNKLKSLTEEVFKANLKLSDSLANIRKVSGLSTEAINQLYRNISKIDTRNTIETLNQLAYTGAKLGIGQNYGVEGLTGFVKAAEQVQMALGEDMGEKALPELSKMVEVMGLIPKYGVEQSMQKAASAIFQLGATSTATGANIVEFSKRLMGLANVSRISTDDLLALGSASDAMGNSPEVAATAFSKLFTSIQKNHNLIEKSLGMTKGTIKDFYDQGKTIEAIIEIFERMNKKGNMNLLGSIFKDLGSDDGARMIRVMVTMADRADILRKHLQTSRDAFKEGEAVIGEYMIQNQTAAALVERASNLWAKAFVNPEGVDMVKQLAQQWYDLSKAMTQSDAQMASLRISLNAVALVIQLLIKSLPFLIRLMMMFGVAQVIRGLYNGYVQLRTAIDATYVAQGKLNTAMKSNWILAIVSALVAAATMLYDYSKAAEEAAKREAERQAKLKAAFEESKEAVQNVVKPLEVYKNALDDASLSEKQRMALVKQFKTDYQDYLDYLGIEIESAVDLAKAYAQVVTVMRQKKAYEERESYRQQQNGENRMSRIEYQAMVESEARSLGIEGIDKEYLEGTQNVRRNGKIISRGSYDVATEILRKKYGENVSVDNGEVLWVEIIDKNAPLSAANQRISETGIDASGLINALNSYIKSYRAERNLNNEINQMFNAEYKDIDLEHFDIDEFNDRVQRAQWNRKGSLDNEKPDKDAIAAAKKEVQERKKALKLEMDEAQKASTGIISKLEEYYRLQEAAINDARADGQLTEKRAEEMVRALSIVKNESLATARRALTTGDTKDWDELKTKVLPAVMADTSEVSRNLLSTIQQVAVDKAHADLEKFNGSSDVLGLDSRAFFDQMNAKAAGNTREAARLKAKLFTQAETMVKQYRIFDQAVDRMRNDVEQMGFITETYEEFADRMQKGIMEKPDKVLPNGQKLNDKQIYSAMGFKFLGQGTIPYRINIENGDEALEWMRQFGTTVSGELEVWAQAIPELEKWVTLLQRKAELQKEGKDLTADELAELQKAIPQIQALYYKMNEFSDKVPEAITRQVQQMTGRKPIGIVERGEQHAAQVDLTTRLYDNKINEARNSGNENAALELEEQKKQALIDLEYKYQQELYQIREQMGVNVFEQYENEVAGYKNMLDKKLISEKQFQQKKGQLQMKLGLDVAQQYNQMMSNMVNALQEAEIASVEAKYDAEINAAKANGQDTAALEEQKEAEIMEIRKKYAGLQFAVKISEIIANTAVAIMQAYAQLGPVGGSIAAAMLSATGAAQLALAKAEYDKVMGMQAGGSKKSASSTKTNTKLVSSMLTYDSGNVGTYAGTDGHVYRAASSPAPGTGLITRPIATTVQGNPALVAERGPEIVIGRRATANIMRWNPALLNVLASYDPYSRRRTYDEGTPVPSVAPALPSGSPEGQDPRMEETLASLAQTVALLSATVSDLQKKGIPAHINKYGTGGLIDEVKSGLKFDARYSG